MLGFLLVPATLYSEITRSKRVGSIDQPTLIAPLTCDCDAGRDPDSEPCCRCAECSPKIFEAPRFVRIGLKSRYAFHRVEQLLTPAPVTWPIVTLDCQACWNPWGSVSWSPTIPMVA